MYRFLAHLSFTCVDGNALVRSVSCVSSTGRLRGTLRTNAAWSGVAAHAVIRKPADPKDKGLGMCKTTSHTAGIGCVLSANDAASAR